MDRLTANIRGIHAEELVNTVLKGTITRSSGYDILTKKGYRVEVRSRNKFTDGRTPRVTVNESKMRCSDIISFVQYNRDPERSVAVGVLIPTKHLGQLYKEYRQKNGNAHIPLHKVMSLPKAMDITARLVSADINLKSKGFYL